ncbi:MAG: hypothetical protein HOW73_20015 [Polyangiaceae bacterium]|nr:hypothetical protein [Polyangiaceae bacterium]
MTSFAPRTATSLADWLIANDRVSRCNRDLLQYASMLAALLGIAGATGGVLQLAKSMRGTSWSRIEIAAFAVVFGLTVGLFVAVVVSWLKRDLAQRKAEQELRRLPGELLDKVIRREGR